MLVWTLLILTLSISLTYQLSITTTLTVKWLIFIPIVTMLVSTPLSGWLADAKFGNHKVFRFGAVLLFISMVVNCILLMLKALVPEGFYMLELINLCLTGSFSIAGLCACVVTALPLGLDQMPDASTSSITSYISWFVCAFFVAELFGKGLSHLLWKCLDGVETLNYTLVWALFLAICMGVVLSSIFVANPKWLIIEPKSPQSFKTIYQVLKFAAKHKAPLNRSAFTYWEDGIPSRIDLGKSKYGGPFTTEQVENVKTILHLLGITFPLHLLFFSVFFTSMKIKHEILSPQLSTCESYIIENFLASSSVSGIIGTIAHEFLVYPLMRNRIPSTLKRIGTVSLIMTLVSLVCFALKFAHFLSYSSENITSWMILIIQHLATGILGQVLLTSILEFMCAQSPYNMRGLLLSLEVSVSVLAISVGWIIWFKTSIQQQNSPILYSGKAFICLIAFLLFCVVARWYKRRVRDDNYYTQQVVEEVYDRYLTAAAAHSQSYGV